jgi:tRNA(Ile)-lysidine synthase
MISAGPGLIAGRSAVDGCGIEAAARDFRLDALHREADRLGAERIAIGHTRDDSLEHVLIRVLRGSGPAGLAALPMDRGRIVRPLLRLGRSEVLSYLGALGISYRTDSTNGNPVFLRNRVRLKLVPLLDRDFPGWQGAILAMARTQSKAAEFLSAEAETRIVWTGSELVSNELTTDEANFFNQDVILREEALFRVVDMLSRRAVLKPGHPRADPAPRGRREPRRESIAVFASGVEKAMDLGPVRVERRGSRIVAAISGGNQSETGFVLVVRGPGVVAIEGFSFSVEQAGYDTKAASGSGDRVGVALPVVIRSCTPHDRGRARLALKDGSVPAGIFALVEDPLGIVALLVRVGAKDLVLKGVSQQGLANKEVSAGYARSAFFSIL